MGWSDFLGSAISGVASIFGAHKSSKAQRHAADRAAEAQERIYQQQREDYAPWRETGSEAIRELWDIIQKGPGEFKESPEYSYLVDQMLKAVRRGSAARRTFGGGAYDIALMSKAADLASLERDRFLNEYYASLRPYQTVAGIGQTAATGTAAAGADLGRVLTKSALARGQATADMWSDITGAITGAARDYSLYQGQQDFWNRLNQLSRRYPNSTVYEKPLSI